MPLQLLDAKAFQIKHCIKLILTSGSRPFPPTASVLSSVPDELATVERLSPRTKAKRQAAEPQHVLTISGIATPVLLTSTQRHVVIRRVTGTCLNIRFETIRNKPPPPVMVSTMKANLSTDFDKIGRLSAASVAVERACSNDLR